MKPVLRLRRKKTCGSAQDEYIFAQRERIIFAAR
jgi:hypothetical protein